MVINYKQAYQKIKIKQLETLLSNIKSFKLKQNPLADDEFNGKQMEQIIDLPLSSLMEGGSSVWFIKMIEQ